MTSEVLEKEKIDKIRFVKIAYAKSFAGSLTIVVIGLLISIMINRTKVTIDLLQAFSIVPGSAALFGVQGWNIQTWSGTTPAEILNQKLFRILSTTGFLLAVVAFSLHSEPKRESYNNTNQDIVSYQLESEKLQKNSKEFE